MLWFCTQRLGLVVEMGPVRPWNPMRDSDPEPELGGSCPVMMATILCRGPNGPDPVVPGGRAGGSRAKGQGSSKVGVT